MLSNSLIQFSVDGGGPLLSLFFDLRPNYGGGNEDNGSLLQKVPRMHGRTQCPRPCSRPPPPHCLHWSLLDTHRQVWVSLLWSYCSFLLDPGAHKVLFVPSKSLFPQSCVSSGALWWGKWQPPPRGLMAHSSLLHPEPLPLWQTTADP